MSRRPGRRRADRPWIVAAVAALTLGLAAVGCSSNGATGDESGPTGPAGSETAVDAGLLSVTAPAVGGGEVDLGAFAGRPLVLWFWAPG